LPYDAWVTGSGPHFQVASWLIRNLNIHGFGLRVYGSLAATSLLGAAFTIAFIGHKKKNNPKVGQPDRHVVAACWLLLGGCWFLMTGWSWPVWEYVPFLSQVQFPWRLGILVDFISLFLVALSAPHVMPVILSRLGIAEPRLKVIERAVVSFGLGASVILVMWMQFPPTVQSKDELTESLTIEYRPKWLVESAVYLPSGNVAALKDREVAPRLHDRGMDRWQDYIKPLPSIASLRDLESGESVSIHSDDITRATISTVLESPATLRVKKLYYPHWRLTDGDETAVNVRADAQTGLLLVDLPPGRHTFILDRRILPIERVGMFVSLLTVVVSLAGLVVFPCKTCSPATPPVPSNRAARIA
jgi:hypothetical protein